MSFTQGWHRTFPLPYCAHNRRPEAHWGIACPPCGNGAWTSPRSLRTRGSSAPPAQRGGTVRGRARGIGSAPSPCSPRAARDGGHRLDGRAWGRQSGRCSRWHSSVTVRSPSVLAPGSGRDRGMARLVLQAPHGVFHRACPESSRVSVLPGRWHTEPRAGTAGGTRPPPPPTCAPQGLGGRARSWPCSGRCFRT